MATIIQNLRCSRKRAAPGPSGLTADTLRLLLDDELATVAQHVARAQVPATIASALGLGRVVALQKPNGRVRGIIIGDFPRRLVARSLAQHYATAIHAACAPHQFALSRRAGTETVVRAITLATQANHQHTVLSVDGIGAYDTISRTSMMQGLIGVPGAQQCLPFVRMFYGMVGTVATPISFPRQRGGGARRPVDASVVFPASTGAPPSHPEPTPTKRVAAGISRRSLRRRPARSSSSSLRPHGP